MNVADIDRFCNRVNKVTNLIDSLKNGDLSPGNINLSPTIQPSPLASPPERKSTPEAKEKVSELLSRHKVKTKRREKFEEYRQKKDKLTSGQGGTDYLQWELWCPSDEEDDLVRSCGPSNPALQALEKDADDRHERQPYFPRVDKIVVVAGNKAFRNGQYQEAYRLYCAGLEIQKHDIALHSNAALASYKFGAYVETIEHCDKVLDIGEKLLNKPKHPFCGKALVRRGHAKKRLGHFKEALADLEKAMELDPNTKEVYEDSESLRRLIELKTRSDHLMQQAERGGTETLTQQLAEALDQIKSILKEMLSEKTQGMKGMSTNLKPKSHACLGIRRALRRIENCLHDEDLRLVFLQQDGLFLNEQVIHRYPDLIDLCFRVLSHACANEMLVEKLLGMETFFKNAWFANNMAPLVLEEDFAKYKGWTAFLLSISKHKDGRRKLLETIFRPLSCVAQTLIKNISSDDDIIDLFAELVVESEGRKLFALQSNLMEELLTSTLESLKLCLSEQKSKAYIAPRLCDLLSSLARSNVLKEQILSKKEIAKTLVEASELSLQSCDYRLLSSILALIANCFVSASSHPTGLGIYEDSILNHIKTLLEIPNMHQNLHSIALVLLSRLTSNEKNRKRVLEGKTMKMIVEVVEKKRLDDSGERAALTLFARLTAQELHSLDSSIQQTIMNLCKKVVITYCCDRSRGNAMFVLSSLAKTPSRGKEFIDEGLVRKLIELANVSKGAVTRNAAICLACIAQEEATRDLIRKYRGFEVMYNAMNKAK